MELSKNKILVFGITENPGGVESVIMNYYRNIDREKIQFDFLCNSEVVAYEQEILKLGGNIYRITARSKNYKKYREDLKEFFKRHAKEYTTIWVNVCSLANIDYLKYAKKYGIKYRIIHSHNSQNMDSKIRGILHRINRILIKKYATDFWACSKDAGNWFYNKKIIKSNRYLIVNNAIDTDKYKYNTEIRDEYRKKLKLEDNLVIGNIGRLHFQKNQIFLLKIFEEIYKKNKNAKLLIIGQGEDENLLKEECKKRNLQDKVMFLGVRNDIPQLLQAMDIFIFPSLFEGLPLTLLEAQVSGLPIYTSKDVIPENIKMSDNLEFISLEKNEKEWAEIILQKKEILRCSKDREIKEKGYDIKVEAKKIEKYFERE